MFSNHPILPPAGAPSSLALAAEVFAQWEAGKEVVMNISGITVDGVPLFGADLLRGKTPGRNRMLVVENPPNICQFDGKKWTLQFEGKRVFKQKQLGFHYIHAQLKTPCIGVKSNELVAAINCHKLNCVKPEQVIEQIHDEGFTPSPRINACESVPVDEMVDQTTLLQVRQKMKSLAVELESFQAKGDEVAAKEVETEIQGLEDYLDENCHGKRSTSFDNGANKNRKSVSAAIKRAIASLAGNHPSLALHLKNSIKTGFSCCYIPEKKTEWVV